MQPHSVFPPTIALRLSGRQPGVPHASWAEAQVRALAEPVPGAHVAQGTVASPLSEAEQFRVLELVQEAVSAALSSEADLCELRCGHLRALCAPGTEAAALAAAEFDRLLAIDIVERHLDMCHRRRLLRRNLALFARQLHPVGQGLTPTAAGQR